MPFLEVVAAAVDSNFYSNSADSVTPRPEPGNSKATLGDSESTAVADSVVDGTDSECASDWRNCSADC